MTEYLPIICVAFSLGFSTGISPGPLTLFVIKELLSGRYKNALFLSMTPVITDLPILIFLILTIGRLAESNNFLAWLGVFGAIYLTRIGWSDLSKSVDLNIDSDGHQRASLKRMLLINFLNPNPYIFWATVGLPFIRDHSKKYLTTGFVFFIIFVLSMAFAKLTLGFSMRILIGRSTRLLHLAFRFSGLLMWLFAVALIYKSYLLWYSI